MNGNKGKCWLCGNTSAAIVHGPRNLAMCHSCVKQVDVGLDIPGPNTCGFCSKRIGSRYGVLHRGVRRACAVNDSEAICNVCLQLMKDVVEEKDRKTGTDERPDR